MPKPSNQNFELSTYSLFLVQPRRQDQLYLSQFQKLRSEIKSHEEPTIHLLSNYLLSLPPSSPDLSLAMESLLSHYHDAWNRKAPEKDIFLKNLIFKVLVRLVDLDPNSLEIITKYWKWIRFHDLPKFFKKFQIRSLCAQKSRSDFFGKSTPLVDERLIEGLVDSGRY